MADENELLEQFAARFAPGPQDGADATPAHFDVDRFLAGLDAIFDRHAGATEAQPYLEQAMADAENAGDDAGLLTVLNEAMGFYRSQGLHQENEWTVQRTLELAARMGLEGTEAWATTLINCATAMRAAGKYDQSEDLYRQALDCAATVYRPDDRRIAALHNNLSVLYSETGRLPEARAELEQALATLTAGSPDPSTDLDVASTHTNLALILLQMAQAPGSGDAPATDGDNRKEAADLLAEADAHASEGVAIFEAGDPHAGHFASALAGMAQVRYAEGRFADAVAWYRRALAVIEECYGEDNDYHRITAANLREAEQACRDASQPLPDDGAPADAAAAGTAATTSSAATAESTAPTASPAPAGRPGDPRTGLRIARDFWEQRVRPMLRERYPEQVGRIAAGLVGHGSECYGFDDALSQDHDFGPRCCLWLTDEDYDAFGERLQADYEALDRGDWPVTPRAQGAGRRDGVFRIGDFFESITDYREAPAADRPHEWLMLDEATLAAATNGEVFADPLGAFSAARQAFKDMPGDVRLSLISRRLGMMAQAGQYNLPRMLERGDGAAAMLSVTEFVNATASLVYLVNEPITVGYLPYYKWRFAALRRLSGRLATRLADVCGQLESMLRLASAACYGGAGFGEGGKGAGPAIESLEATVARIAQEVVDELRREGLTRSGETFLEWQRPYVEEHIGGADPVLRSL